MDSPRKQEEANGTKAKEAQTKPAEEADKTTSLIEHRQIEGSSTSSRVQTKLESNVHEAKGNGDESVSQLSTEPVDGEKPPANSAEYCVVNFTSPIPTQSSNIKKTVGERCSPPAIPGTSRQTSSPSRSEVANEGEGKNLFRVASIMPLYLDQPRSDIPRLGRPPCKPRKIWGQLQMRADKPATEITRRSIQLQRDPDPLLRQDSDEQKPTKNVKKEPGSSPAETGDVGSREHERSHSLETPSPSKRFFVRQGRPLPSLTMSKTLKPIQLKTAEPQTSSSIHPQMNDGQSSSKPISPSPKISAIYVMPRSLFTSSFGPGGNPRLAFRNNFLTRNNLTKSAAAIQGVPADLDTAVKSQVHHDAVPSKSLTKHKLIAHDRHEGQGKSGPGMVNMVSTVKPKSPFSGTIPNESPVLIKRIPLTGASTTPETSPPAVLNIATAVNFQLPRPTFRDSQFQENEGLVISMESPQSIKDIPKSDRPGHDSKEIQTIQVSRKTSSSETVAQNVTELTALNNILGNVQVIPANIRQIEVPPTDLTVRVSKLSPNRRRPYRRHTLPNIKRGKPICITGQSFPSVTTPGYHTNMGASSHKVLPTVPSFENESAVDMKAEGTLAQIKEFEDVMKEVSAKHGMNPTGSLGSGASDPTSFDSTFQDLCPDISYDDIIANLFSGTAMHRSNIETSIAAGGPSTSTAPMPLAEHFPKVSHEDFLTDPATLPSNSQTSISTTDFSTSYEPASLPENISQVSYEDFVTNFLSGPANFANNSETMNPTNDPDLTYTELLQPSQPPFSTSSEHPDFDK